MFALESLAAVGEHYSTSSHVKRACDFLISKQREDGGWSESFKVRVCINTSTESPMYEISPDHSQTCKTEECHEDPSGSLVIQTVWALIGLVESQYPGAEPLKRGAWFLMGRQQDNGEWLKEAIPGAFHNFCTFSYPNYKFTFTIKALGMLADRLLDFRR